MKVEASAGTGQVRGSATEEDLERVGRAEEGRDLAGRHIDSAAPVAACLGHSIPG